MSENVKVNIFDQTYYVAGELEPNYVQELAQHVDTRMRDIARATGTVDTVKVAVLAAMAIADEMYSLRETRQNDTQELRERTKRCLKLVERALRQSA